MKKPLNAKDFLRVCNTTSELYRIFDHYHMPRSKVRLDRLLQALHLEHTKRLARNPGLTEPEDWDAIDCLNGEGLCSPNFIGNSYGGEE